MAEPPSGNQVLATPAPDLEPPAPDIMNDPQFATNTEDGEDGLGDADTCRICRGEGGDAEPLFHPCKCSGSIKYVHQDCLMEWLSHSQKKHCELCKTPFRFTKLYSPNMPQSLPFHVLIRHVIIHIAKNLATWLRACLVVVVWLACLPYIIRQVWRLLFWMSDGGWPASYSRMMGPFRNATSIQALEMAREFELATLYGNETTPSTPFHPAPTTPASYIRLVNKLVSFLSPISQTLNISGSDPLAAGLFKSLKYGFGIKSVVIPENHADNATIDLYPMSYTPPSSPSLLGDVSFLKNLTRNATVNDAIINIAEGYIITILVVVCFILVFLIREWVVQQQPGINMGAGFNAEFAAAQPNIDRPRRNANGAALRAREENQNPIQIPQDGVRERPIARPRRRNNRAGEVDEAPVQRNDTEQNENVYQNVYNPVQGENGGPSASGRPSPPRDALSPAADIQRRLTEEPQHTEEFLAIWRRADSDPQEVLRIIERENKGDDMRYWVNAMKVLQTPVALGNGRLRPNANDDDNDHDSIQATASDRAVQVENGGSSASSESWVDIPQPVEAQQTPLTEDSLIQHREVLKGKGRATEESDNQLSETRAALQSRTNLPSQSILPDNSFAFAAGPSRPRAISDGPQRKDNISPLANNNWSFSNLSDEETSPIRETSTTAHTMQNETGSDADFDPADLVPLRSLLSPEAEEKLVASLQPAEPSAHVDNGPRTGILEPSLLRMLEGEVPEVQGFEEDNVPSTSQDDIGRGYQALEEAFPANPDESDSENDIGQQTEVPEANPFEPDTPLPAPQEPWPRLPQQADVPFLEPQDAPPNARPVAPQGVLGHVADFLWGGVGDDEQVDQGGNDEQIVQDIAAEAPFVPVAHHDVFEQADAVEQDREVVEAALAAGIDPNDQDAIDDAEDFEGIMELVGMRGPIFSLVQNALFSAFLLALAVAIGVWIPYNIGRVSLLLIGNPGPTLKLPLRLVYGCIALLQDLSLFIIGGMSYLLITVGSWMLKLYSTGNGDTARGLGSAAMKLSQNSAGRIVNGTLNNFGHLHESEIFAFSAASHESLITIKSCTIDSVAGLGASVRYFFTGNYSVTWQGFLSASMSGLRYVWNLLASIPSVLARPDSWVISLESPKRVVPLDLELSIWDGWDRFWAIFGGYAALCILGALYVKKGSPFSSGQQGRDWEASIIDLLNQAGGVMKVILIISIEMLVFPLYCGLLLDAALLPLFDNATIMSRLLFTFNSPFTSLFVHWFVGTCYMFHFALFVSMCRKIMRKGVLYFIRDPDDPTFHPVRDVLERNVATQLRKIMFSALVYGALVVVCLGGVVWGLAFAFKGVLPIHWSSNEPVLEFPIDLLFYNFLMPMAVRFFKPSDGLHSMYSWWFRQCARMLRLTWFMFDERKLDEEGYHVRKNWTDVFKGVRGDPKIPVRTKDRYKPFKEDPELKAYFRLDGKYVRAPASDQVRIPKGISIFLEVDSTNRRIDGKAERPNGVHSKTSDLYKQVYIPPFFRFRICLFILFIWLFAAATGVGITIVPLVFGRQIFGKIIPPHVRKNDVYAFSIGIYILGSALYAVLNLRNFIKYLRNALAVNAETPQNVLRRVTKITNRVASIAWTYTAFLFILPTLFAFLVEFYFIVPLHTYFSLEERHVVHFVQSWTLGLLYVKLTTRLILWHADSRPAQSLRRITRNGYLNPDARLATRSFILPATAALSTALAVPWLLAEFVTRTAIRSQPEKHIMVYRYAYPLCLALACIGVAVWHVFGMVKKWRMMIRDEVYLIGERLHNFGDRKVVSPGMGPSPVRRLET